MSNFAGHCVYENASRWPGRIAARCNGNNLTYAGLADLSGRFGTLLRSRGIGPGHTVVLVLPDSFSFLAGFLGCLLGGAIAAPLNTRLRTEDYADCIGAMRPALLVAAPGHEALDAAAQCGLPALALDDDGLDALLEPFAPLAQAHPADDDDLCLYAVTSGTTGHPKVVPHRHADMFAVARHTGEFLGYRQDDVVLSSAKMGHVYGLFASLTLPLSVGATVVLDPGKTTPVETLRLIETERVSFFLSVPVVYTMLLHAMGPDTRLDSLRRCASAGEALPAAVYAEWLARTGLEIWQGYGSSENMTFVVAQRPPDIVPGAAGVPLHPFTVLVADEDGRPAPEGVPGEVLMAGPTLTKGYLNSPEWNARVFTPEGFMRTGDMGVVSGGVLTILGRMDDMLKVGGLWVSPLRVEGALLSHPDVEQCAVTGGSMGGFTLVRAHVVPRRDVAPGKELAEALRSHAKIHLPDYMVPAEIVFRTDMPLTASGKIQRFLLRREEGGR